MTISDDRGLQAECDWLAEYVTVLHQRVAEEQQACQRLVQQFATAEDKAARWAQLVADLVPIIDWSRVSDGYAARMQARYDTLVAHTHAITGGNIEWNSSH